MMPPGALRPPPSSPFAHCGCGGDLLALSLGQYRQGELAFEQAKTGARVALPVSLVPELAGQLEALAARHREAKVSDHRDLR